MEEEGGGGFVQLSADKISLASAAAHQEAT